jgi:hypothetical protein
MTSLTNTQIPSSITVNVSDGNSIEVTMEKYSEKSFVVKGETTDIKETMKSLGGKWNSRLKCGPAWIFSIKKIQVVVAGLSDYKAPVATPTTATSVDVSDQKLLQFITKLNTDCVRLQAKLTGLTQGKVSVTDIGNVLQKRIKELNAMSTGGKPTTTSSKSAATTKTTSTPAPAKKVKKKSSSNSKGATTSLDEDAKPHRKLLRGKKKSSGL